MKKLIIALLCLLVHFADAQNGKKNAPNTPSPVNPHPDTTINGTQFVWYKGGYVARDQKIVLLNSNNNYYKKYGRKLFLDRLRKRIAKKIGIGANNYTKIQVTKTCTCSNNLVLLSHPDLGSIEITPDPDGSSSGGNSLNEVDGINRNSVGNLKQFSENTDGDLSLSQKEGNDTLKIAFIDTGISTTDPNINFNQSSLFSRVRPRESNSEDPFATNFTNPELDAEIEDHSENAHGTNIAHILMTDLSGQNVKITPLKVFKNGHGVLFDALCAMLYAQKTKINIVNCSWGHGGQENPVFRNVIQRLNSSKIMVVCSAGNNGEQLQTNGLCHYPAMFSEKNNVITVSIVKEKKTSLTNCCNYSPRYISYDYRGDQDCQVRVPYSTANYLYGSSYATAWVTGALAKRYFSFGNNPSNGERKQRFLNTLNTNRPNPN